MDLSELALEVAERNARTLEVADRAEFIQGDLFSSAFFKERQECIQNGSDTDKVQAVNSEMQNIVHEAGVSEKDIIKYINENNKFLEDNLNNIIDKLYKKYKEKFDMEYSDEEIKSFLILILMKREEEMYE